MSGGSSPPIISTPGPSHRGRQAMAGIFAHRSQPIGLEPDSGKDDRPGPSVAAQGVPRIRPEEASSPPLTDRTGPPRPRKKARSESDRSSSEAIDKRPRIGPSYKSINEDDEDEDTEETPSSHETSDSESETDSTKSSHSSSSRAKSLTPPKPTPKPRKRTGTAEVYAAKQLRTPPRSPSPTISPILTDRPRGAPTTGCTVGNLESTRYMDLEPTVSNPQPNSIPNPPPSPAFGHASNNCHRAVRCVRCAGEHIVADCPRPREGPFICANCGKGHAAVDKRCVFYRRRARMMGVTIPPPVPPARRAGQAPTPAPRPAPSPSRKGKGKGKSSQALPFPPVNTQPATVEASATAATLMAEANPQRQAIKPRPAPRSINKAGTDLQLTEEAAAMGEGQAAQTIQPPSPMEITVTDPPQNTNTLGDSQPPLPPRPQRERRRDRQDTQPVGLAAWLLSLWEKLSEVSEGVIQLLKPESPGVELGGDDLVTPREESIRKMQTPSLTNRTLFGEHFDSVHRIGWNHEVVKV
ncbi:nascent polypeptide-associated complex subunit alpha, muscle-specific form-like [Bombyx mori]|uniref:nascent polypeptide-associated complex subunit alpha, muscle-specific form-like n=1 Tax=Bombyx mori TaxID=7091 RepID=UPI002ED69449